MSANESVNKPRVHNRRIGSVNVLSRLWIAFREGMLSKGNQMVVLINPGYLPFLAVCVIRTFHTA
jgi:hypothetical protein